ncbi:Phosphatidylinositol 4-phosphate 5-kinase [Arachis hypogaea]|nr:Phosphatidylinositol 4-phosphate 5-kinase [Arachis hypogaea]
MDDRLLNLYYCFCFRLSSTSSPRSASTSAALTSPPHPEQCATHHRQEARPRSIVAYCLLVVSRQSPPPVSLFSARRSIPPGPGSSRPGKKPEIPSMSPFALSMNESSNQPIKWQRVLLKVSGEALAGDHSQNIDPKITMAIAREVAAVTRLGIEVAIVVGGGNIFRGSSWAGCSGLDRSSADYIGQIFLDCTFLEFQHIIDYSLLLGLHFRAPENLRALAEYPRSLQQQDSLSSGEDSVKEGDELILPKGLLLVAHEPGSMNTAPGSHIRGNTLRAYSIRDKEVDLLLSGTARLNIERVLILYKEVNWSGELAISSDLLGFGE